MKYVVAAVIMVIVGVGAFSTWLETPRAVYNSYDDAVRAGAVGPNMWIPEFLPKSASQIVERHNIDTNESSLTFQFSGSDLLVPDSCVKIPSRDSSANTYTCERRTELGGYWAVSTCELSVQKQDASFICGSDTLRGKDTVTPNYALERSVRALSERAAGARRKFTPAARWFGLARPAQRGR